MFNIDQYTLLYKIMLLSGSLALPFWCLNLTGMHDVNTFMTSTFLTMHIVL